MKTSVNQTLEPRCKAFLFSDGRELETLRLLYLHTEQRVNGIPSASLEVSVPGNAQHTLSTDKEMALCQVGATMSVKVYDDELRRQVELFSGVITASSLTIIKGQAILSLILKHKLIQLDNVIRSRVFTDKTDNEIIRAICPSDVAKIDNQASMDIRHEQRVQFRCSDWRMLRYCLDACGAWLIATPAVVKIVQPKLAAQPEHQLQAEKGTLMEKASWQFSAVDQPTSLKLTAWDIDSQSLTSASAQQRTLGSGALKPGGGTRLSETPWVLGYGTSPSVEELRRQADSLLLSLQIKGVQGEFSVQGSSKYQPGQTLKLSGFGQYFDGTGMMTAVMHTITPSRWTTTIMLGPSGQALAVPPQSQISGIQPGVVATYDKSDKLYRIRIHLNALDSDKNKNQLWARFAMPYATKGSSFICYPEPGDEVAVGFFEGNPDYPVIVGALHNPERPPAVEPGKDKGLKGWKTDELQLQIDTSNHTLMLQAGDKSNLIIDKSDAMTVKSDNGVNIIGKKGVSIEDSDGVSITGNGDKGVSIEGSGGVTIKGKKIDLTN
ncbi:Phage-related baseplate assembly protein [compost metagenome]